MIPPQVRGQIQKYSEKVFGTDQDPDQMPINEATYEKLVALHPATTLYRTNERGEPIAWVVVFPTTKELMEQFLTSQINERQLFDLTVPGSKFDSLYLCAAITLPEYQRSGLAIGLLKEAIDAISQGHELQLFGWAYAKEGRYLGEKLQQELGRTILARGI